MLRSVFETLLLSTFMGSVAAGVVLLLRPVTRKWFSPDWQYYIWLLVLTAFVLPVPKRITVEYLPSSAPVLYRTALNTFPKVTVHAPNPPDIMTVLATVWGVGVLVFALFKLVRYALFKGRLRCHSTADRNDYALPHSVSVRRTWLLDAPLVIGLVCPVLYLPESVDEAELPYILAHESVHCKRRDLLFKWYAQAVSTFHWFNPIFPLIIGQIDAECEASCDHIVTRNWEPSKTDTYMRMILNHCSPSGMRPLTTKMFSGKSVLKRRFSAVRRPRKESGIMRGIAILTALLMCFGILWFGNALATDFHTRQVVIVAEDARIPRAVAPIPEPVLPLEEPLSAVGTPEPPPPEPQLPEPEESPLPAIQARIGYNSDVRERAEVSIYPDEAGVISFRFESPVPNATAEINIRRADHPAGWGYFLPTDSETLYSFDGFTPGEPYVLTLDAYCAGRYGIEGALIIY